MHSFIVATPPDLPASENTYHIQSETAIGISDIRAIQHYLSRKATSNQPRTVIVHAADTMTIPAQHAFLKTLEEPPANTAIYLVTPKPDLLLPTILSRCQVDTQSAISLSTPASRQLCQDLLAADSVGQRLLLLDEAKMDRDAALQLVDAIEHTLHSQIRSHSPLSPVRYQLVTDTRRFLLANCSVRLALDHLALNL